MDSREYAIRIFNNHVEKAGMAGQLAGKTILEIGPGDSISTAIIAAAHGARAILVDAGPFVRVDTAPYRSLISALAGSGLSVPGGLQDCNDVTGILARCNARYLTEGLASLRQLENDSIDLMFSQAVLEHVRKHEFLETMKECRRILKPDGVCSHHIDLQDHLAGALNNLRFSARVWESDFFAKSGFYTNRIQFSRMRELFIKAGFQVECLYVRRWSALPTPRQSLAGEFRGIADDELSVSGFDVLLRRAA
jgi:SAM-dependent methyltransferase